MDTNRLRQSTLGRVRGMSRRAALGTLGAVAAGAAIAGTTRSVVAQESMDRTGHPLIGSWLITGPSGSPDAVNSFNSDGIAQTSGRSGFGEAQAGFLTSAAVGFGVWDATGERTAAMTWIIPTRDDQNNALNIVFRGVIEVSEDAQSFESQVLLDVQTPDGTSMVMFPNMVSGKRIVVEPMPDMGSMTASPVSS